MKKIIQTLILIFITSNLSLAKSQEDAKSFVSNITKEVISIMSNNSISDQVKENELTNLFIDLVDIEWIGKFALGRYSKNLNEDQEIRYNETFKKMLIKTYVPNFKKYTNETFNVNNVISSNKEEFLVQTEIIKDTKNHNIKVDYALKLDQNGKFKIFDIIAEGVSLITTQRNDFNSILSKNDINYLIEELNKKITTVN